MNSTDNTPFQPQDDYSNSSNSSPTSNDDTQATSKKTTETGIEPANAKTDTEPVITEVGELPGLPLVSEELGIKTPQEKSDKKESKETQTGQTKSTEGKTLHAVVNPPINLDKLLTDSNGHPVPTSPQEIADLFLNATPKALSKAAETTGNALSNENPSTNE
jgi:hypothetical protein